VEFGCWQWGVGMDSLRELLEAVRDRVFVRKRFRGLLHILVGRRIARADGTPLSSGMSWRDAANLLKRLRLDREIVRQWNVDPADLPPRDRERFWYAAISRAALDSPEVIAEAEQLIPTLEQLGYIVGPPPRPSKP
jgi:hypothetical protein